MSTITAARKRLVNPMVSVLLTAAILALILRRVPLAALGTALRVGHARAGGCGPLVPHRGPVRRAAARPRRLLRGRVLQHESGPRRDGGVSEPAAARAVSGAGQHGAVPRADRVHPA